MTGARPTGGLHIGQYFAAFAPFVEQYEDYEESFFVVSDLHMLTTKFTPESTRGIQDAVRRLVAESVSFGIDPEKTYFYLQSRVPWQARIYVILQSLADAGRLGEHGSFAEMAHASRHVRPPTLGLMGYPILESSDVLSIGATHVTVGEGNQSHFQHLSEILTELREGWGLAINAPEVVIGRPNLVGTDGSAKMSKSLNNAVFFSDGPDAIADKVALMPVERDGRCVPAEYLRALGTAEESVAETERELRGVDTLPAPLAKEITERIVELVDPVRQRADELLADPGVVDGFLRRGLDRAHELGQEGYDRLAERVGLAWL